MDEAYMLNKASGDAKAIAKSIRENCEKAAMLMDKGDCMACIMTFTVEQIGDVADAKALREHIARQMLAVAVHLTAN